MITHGSIDIETLDVDPSHNAAIIAVGIVAFNNDDILDEREWILDAAWSPGSRSKSTMDWWMDQEFAIRERMFSGKVLPWDFCPEFSSFIGLNGITQIWGYPARFDIGHLRSLYRAMECPFPLDFRSELDMSTLVDLAREVGLSDELKRIRDENKSAHDALADARNQARRLQFLFKWFGAYRG